MTWASLSGNEFHFRASPLESARFDVTIGRLTVGWDCDESKAAEFVARVLSSADEELIIGRWPSRMLRLGAVAAKSGRAVLHADALVYWEAAPEVVLKATDATPDPTIHVGQGSPDPETRVEAVRMIVEDAFQAYGSHYLANPDLAADGALAGYVEWAERTMQDRPGDVLLMRVDGQPVGVATLICDRDMNDLEIELAGLVRAVQGKGLYSRLLRECARQAEARGSRRLLISTQVQNIRVQRLWSRAGMVPFASFDTIHATTPPPKRPTS
jgi:GNAT superfamily N-acetyltransferase